MVIKIMNIKKPVINWPENTKVTGVDIENLCFITKASIDENTKPIPPLTYHWE